MLSKLILAIFLISIAFFIFQYFKPSALNNSSQMLKKPSPQSSSFSPNFKTSAKYADAYTILLVGDSIISYLGPNSDSLRASLKTHYKDKVFGIFNYGCGSTNILTLKDRLEKTTNCDDKSLPPILDREFEVIIIESFANNPLSNHSLEEGLKIHTQKLQEATYLINQKKPNSVIIFLTPFAPSNHYAQGDRQLTDEQSKSWALERTAYIKNHIAFAQSNKIPLINVYEKSLKEDGTVMEDLINPGDHIHPSQKGVDLISKEIADYLFNSKVLLP